MFQFDWHVCRYGSSLFVIQLGIFALANANQPLEQHVIDEFKPKSFRLAFQEINQFVTHSSRKIILYLEDQFVGDVSYTIRKNFGATSTIDFLHVEKPYRAKFGCGKILLRQAIDDILGQGYTSIGLNRYPYDLKQGDVWDSRDQQLMKWYGNFGFESELGTRGFMVLKNFKKLHEADIVSSFSANGVQFKPRLVPDCSK